MAKLKPPSFIAAEHAGKGLSSRAVDTAFLFSEPDTDRWLDAIENYDIAKDAASRKTAKLALVKLLRNDRLLSNEIRFLLADLIERELRPRLGRSAIYRPPAVTAGLLLAEERWRAIEGEQKAIKEGKIRGARAKRVLEITQHHVAIEAGIDPGRFDDHLNGRRRYSRKFKQRLPRA